MRSKLASGSRGSSASPRRIETLSSRSRSIRRPSSRSASVSMSWAYLAMPVGGLFCVVGIIGNLIDPQRMELETAQ